MRASFAPLVHLKKVIVKFSHACVIYLSFHSSLTRSSFTFRAHSKQLKLHIKLVSRKNYPNDRVCVCVLARECGCNVLSVNFSFACMQCMNANKIMTVQDTK